LLTVFAGIINLTIALEVSQGVARFSAGEQDPERKVAYASTAFWFTLACYSFFAVPMLVLADSIAGWIMGQPGLETAFRLGIIHIWINGLYYLIQNQFRWELRSKEFAVISLLVPFITAAFSVWLAYWLRWGLEGLLIGMVIGSLLGLVAGVWRLRGSVRFQFDVIRLREMLAFSTPLVFSSVAVWVSFYIDRIMIKHFLTIEELGLYGIGYRLASVAGLVMVGFQGALTPLVYTHYREADTPLQLARIFRIFLVFALLAFLGLSLFANEILHIMTTPTFYGGADVVVYLIPAFFLAKMYIFAPGIGLSKRVHYLIWINSGGALLNIALNSALIPIMGITGAALATMLNYLSVFTAHMVLSQRLYHVPHQWRSILAALIVACALAWSVPKLPLLDSERWGLNLVSLLAFFAIAMTLGLVRIDELQKGKALLKERLLPGSHASTS